MFMEPGTRIISFKDNKNRMVTVTTLAASDLDDLLAYANNLIAEDTFVLLSGKPLTLEHEKKYVKDTLEQVKKKKKIHLIARVNGEFASSFEVRILPLRKSHVAEVGISVSRKFRNEGIGKKCMELLISEAKKIGLRMLVLTCFATNDRAIHMYESLGFVECGRVPEMLLYKGKYEDEISMYLPLT